jgi:hypothetical protein
MQFQNYDKEVKTSFLDNYGALDLLNPILIIGQLEIQLTDDEVNDIIKMLEPRLRKEIQ